MEEKKKTMKVAVLEKQEIDHKLVIKEIDIPELKNGQVLVKVEYSPINPSDLEFLKGTYLTDKPVPSVPGFEGSGTVVDSKGPVGWFLQGKRVAMYTGTFFLGAYSQYCVCNALEVMPLPDDVTFETASSSFVNPLTCIAMLDVVQSHKGTSVVFTACASQLGRMVVKYFQKNGVDVIAVIRRQEQEDILKKIGAKYILNQNDEDFGQQLQKITKELGTKVAFDPVSGVLSGQILRNMPNKSILYIYGNLSQEELTGIDTADLVFRNCQIKGFYLTNWLDEKGLVKQALLMKQLRNLLNNDLNTEIQRIFPLSEINEAVKFYKENMTKGKVLIEPWK